MKKHKPLWLALMVSVSLTQAGLAYAKGETLPYPARTAQLFIPIAETKAAAPSSSASEASAPGNLTLNDALAEAYQKNPDLQAIRAELKSVGELYPQASAGMKPTLSGTADYTSAHTGSTRGDAKTLSLQVTQNLYSGGTTLANMNQSTNTIKAERAKLQVTEQQVLLNAVTAYMNLIRDQQIVELNRNNEKVLESHLQASRERFKLGDITKTDVSLSEAGLAKSTASRIAAEGQLKNSRAFFQHIIGMPPGNLTKPDVSLKLPATSDEAIALAEKNNPSVVLAGYSEQASHFAIKSIEGENLPKLDLTGTTGSIYDPVDNSSTSENTQSIVLRATLPLYVGGSTASRLRQAKYTQQQLHMQTDSAQRTAHEAVIEAWEGLASAEAETKALQTQIDAAKLGRDGIKVEVEYGSRTTLDLLDAEQAYLDAQVAEVSAERDRIVAVYSLLSAIGGLTAEGLQLHVPLYDPGPVQETGLNFQNQTPKRFGWGFQEDK